MAVRSVWAGCVLGVWLALALGAPVWAAKPQPQAVDWRCEVVYMPAREVWSRPVHIGYDRRRITEIRIDGLPVYAFMVNGTVVWTALDNERIQIDAARRTWHSDFRGQAQGEGRCVEASAKGYDGDTAGTAAPKVDGPRP